MVGMSGKGLMREAEESLKIADGRRASKGPRSRRLVRGGALVLAILMLLVGFEGWGGSSDLMAQRFRRGDVEGEKVPFAPARPLKPRRDIARSPDGRFWQRLSSDGLRDPSNPDFGKLREPSQYLSKLPGKAEEIGNNVDWMAALRRRGSSKDWLAALRAGHVKPKDSLKEARPPERDIADIIMPNTAAMPMVRFSHKSHAAWLDCANCHDDPFIKKAGANRFNMQEILDGQYCGRCHGKVAFPATDCLRCHSVERNVGVAN